MNACSDQAEDVVLTSNSDHIGIYVAADISMIDEQAQTETNSKNINMIMIVLIIIGIVIVILLVLIIRKYIK